MKQPWLFLLACFLLAAPPAQAQSATFTVLHSFTNNNGPLDPAAGLILSGNTLYGTACNGGSSGDGAVFAVSADGSGFATLHSFTNGSDGAYPVGGLTISGNTLYGTASGSYSSGFGTVFAVSANGTGFTTLHSFTNGSDGAHPVGGLILSGNTLYGTASGGGSSGYGTVFAVNTNGSGFATLYTFTNGSDGGVPAAALVLSGNRLYGTAEGENPEAGGTVFAVNTNGSGFATLYAFTNGSDGGVPYAGLILSGNTLYGTANFGGLSNAGTVFALRTDGTAFMTLHSFSGGSGPVGYIGFGSVTRLLGIPVNSDGAFPAAGLILSGNTLYGTAQGGGSSGFGTVFAVNTNGTGFTNLYSFTNGADGWLPESGLILSGNRLYGTAFLGPNGEQDGTAFALNLGGSSSPATPVITWTTPAPITYGTALSANQLNATANAPGSFAYTPPTNTVLNAGTNTLSVVFTPADTVDYTTATNTVSLVVSREPVTIASGITANNKVYDGTTAATLSSNSVILLGVVNGDTVSLDTNGYVANFASAGVGNGIAVAVSGLTLSGTSAANYTLTQPGNLAANITAAPVAPFFIVQPVSQVVSGGQSITFTAAAAGYPAPTYQWQFNGANIANANGSSYTVSSASITNIGFYDVVIANTVNTNSSSVATLGFVGLDMLAAVYITGPIGANYQIEATPALGPANWTALTNVTITAQPYIYVDYSTPTNSRRFYRAVPQ